MPSASSRTTLFDSGRVPLWFRIPALAFGIFAVWLAAAISAHRLFGVNLGLDFKAAHGSFLLGAIAALLIGAIWIYVWFLQLRVFFDAGPQEVTVARRGYLRWHEQRISLADCRGLQVRCVCGPFGQRCWSLTVQFADGQDKLIVDLHRLSDAVALRERLAAAMGLPVEQQVLPPVGLRERSVPALLGRAVGGSAIGASMLAISVTQLYKALQSPREPIALNPLSVLFFACAIFAIVFCLAFLPGWNVPIVRELLRRRSPSDRDVPPGTGRQQPPSKTLL